MQLERWSKELIHWVHDTDIQVKQHCSALTHAYRFQKLYISVDVFVSTGELWTLSNNASSDTDVVMRSSQLPPFYSSVDLQQHNFCHTILIQTVHIRHFKRQWGEAADSDNLNMKLNV